ncbi:hypothetical protein, partial [Streptomyces sp. AK04-3B]|uniref:hypothetical protein n=1 Tax=Streptomyces sp. AK04-3B TaxID=3028650 RepID=UPI0029A26664
PNRTPRRPRLPGLQPHLLETPQEGTHMIVLRALRMRDSVSQQTQWSMEDALDRNKIDLPRDEIKDTMRQAVNDGWKDSDYYLSRAKEQYE